MTDELRTGQRGRKARIGAAVGLLGAGAVAGMVLAGTLSASAASGSGSSSTTSSDAGAVASMMGLGATGMPGAPNGHDRSSAPVRSDESSLSSADAATVKAAALKAVPGGTVYRIEADAGDGAYEAHMTRSDGSLVTVKLDKSFTVTAVEDGMGTGDPRPGGQGRFGPPDGQTSGSGTTTGA